MAAASSVRILASASPGEVRVLAMSPNGAVDAAIWRPGASDGVGDLHRGRLISRMPALAGAFVALDGCEGFLPDSAGGAGLSEGAILGVRITRAAQGGKGPRLTAQIDDDDRALTGSGPPALIQNGPNAVLRLAMPHPDAPVVVDDPGLASTLRHKLGERLSITRQAFDEAAAETFASLGRATVSLPGGSTMHVHPTPALTAIDIDLGSAAVGRREKGVVHRDANLRVLPELARQIRLRNLGGAIVVDLAGLSAKRRSSLGSAFAEALSHDVLLTRFLGFTALGFAEILRPRIHPPMHELLAGPHAAGLEALRSLMVESLAKPSATFRLIAAPAVANALEADRHARSDLVARTGRPLMIDADPTLPPSNWRIEER
jgi:Ribonuclease G/E